jgi:hypothetical protein
MTELINEIREFLIYSAENGYGNEQIKPVKELDKSETIEVSRGELKSHDNYFGGEPYGGRIVIHKNNEPVWMMVYYGRVYELTGLTLQDVYGYLRKNLLKPDLQMPIRGPLKSQEGKWGYVADIKGNLDDFTCEEVIKYDGKIVYKAAFAGGLVDQQSD